MKNKKYSFKKIKKYFSDSIHANKKNLKILLNGLLKITLLIAVTAIVVHFLTSSETLSDYAKSDPSAAYGTSSESSQTSDGSSSATSESSKPAPESLSSTAESSTLQSSTVQSSAVPSSTVTESSAASSESASDDVKTYKPGFTSSALTAEIKNKITGVSFPEKYASATGSSASDDASDNVISYDELRYLNIRYIDFDGNDQNGEMICNKAISDDLLEIFYELYTNDYRIDKICLIDDYSGDDESSMTDDNTSCFNYRTIAGKNKISMHARGLAVDINPLYNPSVTYSKDGSVNISPASGVKYADRTSDFPYKITSDDLAYRLFTEHGFTWGGNWNNSKDYQHFEKKL